MAADLHGSGVSIRLVLPGAIDTEIWDQPDNDPPLYAGPLVPADEVAAGIVDCLASPAFEHYLPDMKAVVEMKTSDFDSFVAGMIAMAEGRVDEEAISRTTDPASQSHS
jgi:short-subunit dehydrogenase